MPTIGVSGAGLIGCSVALRAVRLGFSVAIFEPNPAHLAVARERLGPEALAVPTFFELAERSETLVLAAPLDATVAQLGELRGRVEDDRRVVLDVASVKAPVVRAAAGVPDFITTHPLAGSERSGPVAASADLFAGRVWCYDADASARLRDRAVAFIAAMGARPVPIASEEHDRVVALTSHLPQLLGTALGSYLAERAERDPGVFVFCGTGIRSMLRLAGSSWTVWNPVLHANAVPLAQEVRRLATILSDVADSLEGTEPSLERLFERAGDAYDRLHAVDAATGDNER